MPAHIVATTDGANLNLYLNGLLDGTLTSTRGRTP